MMFRSLSVQTLTCSAQYVGAFHTRLRKHWLSSRAAKKIFGKRYRLTLPQQIRDALPFQQRDDHGVKTKRKQGARVAEDCEKGLQTILY
jgi:hypothetical protein